MNILHNHSLLPYNTFGLDCKAKEFVEVRNTSDLLEILSNYEIESDNVYVLGGGSNILLTKDFDGLVIKNSIKGIEVVKEDDSHIWVQIGAGEVWHDFVMHAIANNWCGVENLSLIPGTVGAAPMQNIGAYGVEIKEVFEELEAMFQDGSLRTFKNEDCQFGYRESIFKHELKGKCVITSVTLRLNKEPDFKVSYGAIQDTLKKNKITDLTIKAVSDAVIEIRQSKLPNPAEIGNAGSFFKNPEIPNTDFEKLKANHPEVPFYPASKEGYTKVPAGWLIEQAGWKGKRIGDIGVHKNQALVLVNYGGGKGNDIYQLALDVKASVMEKFGVEINPEVNIV